MRGRVWTPRLWVEGGEKQHSKLMDGPELGLLYQAKGLMPHRRSGLEKWIFETWIHCVTVTQHFLPWRFVGKAGRCLPKHRVPRMAPAMQRYCTVYSDGDPELARLLTDCALSSKEENSVHGIPFPLSSGRWASPTFPSPPRTQYP